MADQKKFLDYEGVKHLWSKVNMQDYPNNETLMAVINAIDETKLDKNELIGTNELIWDGVALDNIQVDWYMHLVSYDIPEGFLYAQNGKGCRNNDPNFTFALSPFKGENYIGLTGSDNLDSTSGIMALAILKANTTVFGATYEIPGFYLNADPEYLEFVSPLYYEWNLLDQKANKEDLVQSDWNENNQLSLAHIRNRPFYTEEDIPVECILENANTNIGIINDFDINKSYIFEYKGVEYKNVPTGEYDSSAAWGEYKWFGSFYNLDNTSSGYVGWQDTNYPFCFVYRNERDSLIIINENEDFPVTFKIKQEPIIHHIPAKYINPQNIKDMYWDGDVDIAGITFEDIKLATGWDVNKHYLNIPFALGQTWSVRYINKYGNESSYEDLEVQQADDGTLYIGQYPEAMDIPFYITNDVMCGNASWGGMMNPKNINLIGVSGSFNTINQIQPKYIKDMYYDNRHEVATDSVYIENRIIETWGYVKVADSIDFDLTKVKTMYLFTTAGSAFKNVPVNVLRDNMGVHVEYNGDWWFNYFATQEEADYFWDDDDPNPFETGLYIWTNGNEGENIDITYGFTYEDGELHHIPSKYIKDMYYDNGVTVVELIPETTHEFSDIGFDGAYFTDNPIELIEGITYTVMWDNTEYECVCHMSDAGPSIGSDVVGEAGEIENGEPFFIAAYDGGIIISGEVGAHMFSVTGVIHDIKQLDIKYLPIMEEAISELYEINSITNENHEFFDDPSYQMLLGEHRITVDGNTEILEFVDDGDYSFAESDNIYIETWYGGVYFWFPDFDSDNPQIHSVKIEGSKAVIKKEYLPQPDWNQNDPDGEGYIKNRPFYSEENAELILTEGSFFEEVNYMNHFQWDTLSHGFSPGDFVTVIFYEGNGWKELIISGIAEQNNGLTILPIKSNLSYMIKSITCEYDASSGFTIDILAQGFQYVKVISRNKNAIHQIDSKYIKDMYYEDVKYVTYIEEQEINLTGSSQSCSVTIPNINMPWDWVPYRVTFDDVEYEGVMYDNADNAWIDITLNDGTGMTIYQYGHIYINSPDYAGSHTIKVEQKIVNITTLDSKYLDFSAWGGKNFDSYGVDTSIILNNKSNIASGWHSIAAGYYTEANGNDSFANGQNTIAGGSYSHAEGLGNKAYAYASYAGGAYNIQYEYVPRQNKINYSEVLCNVGEQCYYAYDYTWDYNTGTYTLVNPISTTSIPPLNTYIIVRSTTGVMMYFNNTGIQKRSNRNLYDINAGHMKYTISQANRYDEKDMDLPLVTIGNGKSNTRRSNAYTLDRSGNGWFAGDVYIGSASGTNKDEGSKKLITSDDIPEQVFIVTYDSVNDYDDLGEAIYTASREGKVVVFQNGDNFYDLTYSEIEPSHVATFTQTGRNGHVSTIQISYSEITTEDFDTKNYVDTAIANKADKTALEDLQTQVTATSLILADTITGQKYTIQIQNGQLVSFPVEE